MKIAIIGTGGVGGYYGARLAQSGQDVTFIARGVHLKAIKQKGLHIKSVHGDVLISPAKATDNPAEVGPVDLVIFTTKTYQTEDTVKTIMPLIGKDTVVLPLQNGVDAADRIGAAIGMEHMIGGTTWIVSKVEEPGVIGHYSQFHRVAIGELNGKETPRVKAVFDALNAAGVTAELHDNIQKILWTKFVFISAISAMGCLTRVGIGDYRNVPETRKILIAAASEVAAVGRSQGAALDADVIEKTMAFIDAGAPDMRPSMQRDVEAGNLSELESMVGIVVRLGEMKKVPTPVMSMAYALLKPREILVQQAKKS